MGTLGQLHAHDTCTLTACLNPLHPGPCKGWKGGEKEFEKVAGQAKRGIGAYNVPRSVKGIKTSHKAALLSYVNGSGPINRSLRHSKGAGSNHPQIVAEIGAMDRLMGESKLTRPVKVIRAISPSAFGGRNTSVDLTGAEYVDHAFGSTGTDLSLILKHFSETSSGRRPLIADMVLPKGLGAVRAPIGKYGDEKEVLVDRGSHYRVVKDNGFIDTPKGRFRHVTIEVVPGVKPRAKQVDLGQNNQTPRSSVQASINLAQAVCETGQFCMETHKPGLCKGQKRGEAEPGAQDATKQTPAVKAQIAVKGLSTALAQAQAVVAQNAASNPKLAAMARKAAAGYSKALRGHQQTLKQAAQANARAKSNGAQDVKQQDALDRQKANAEKRAELKRETLQKRAQAILARRAEAARVAKMSPKQRAAYGRQKTAQAKAKRAAAEAKVLKQAGKG